MIVLPIVQSCDDCGACCMEQGSPPMYLAYLLGTCPDDGTDDYKRVCGMPVVLKKELLQYAERLARGLPSTDGVCIWFDPGTRRCKHHELRPEICRDFEIGSVECLGWRGSYGVET